ncbi:MAG: 4-alpha-glucanotransferase [Erysipelothrix sp.]|nr:4-alpha-glucanotransferase [Erysipelothrix sp.]
MNKRSSGILMHISSLPGPYGIGDFGQGAYAFVDFLVKSKQRYWQILPLGTTGFGDSPYQNFSAYAGNWYFINLDELIEVGFLLKSEVDAYPLQTSTTTVDYALLYQHKMLLLRMAYNRVKTIMKDKLQHFMAITPWLRDFALFMVLKAHHQNKSWLQWQAEFRIYNSDAVLAFEQAHQDEIYFHVFLQYCFNQQWFNLKRYANKQGVQIIGDIPIYVAEDSVELWVTPHLFQLDRQLMPVSVAGYPPDAFSKTGQLWGNPLYDWQNMADENYSWWITRLRHALKMYDVLRIDHFMGFENYWKIPYGATDAVQGVWVKGPGKKLFAQIKKELGDVNIIAEDLGLITDDVRELIHFCGYPGMKVLQFAFNPFSNSEYLPHNHVQNSVVYTGTHDNSTICGWLATRSDLEMAFIKAYVKLDQGEGYHWGMIRSAWASVANLAIAPMQDFLGLSDTARMNEPATIGKNWRWRLKQEQLTDALANQIKILTRLYHR